jgi:hypothetical protein
MSRHTLTFSKDSDSKIDYMLRNTQADNLNTLIKILINYSYNQIKKRGQLK